jgi:3-vinyl bacteriochlorophyllide hydratase
MVVIALHTVYVGMLVLGIGTTVEQMAIALAAYATYVVNAAQFVWKLRLARLEKPVRISGGDAFAGGAS